MTVAPGRRSGLQQLAMGDRADAMCGVECYSKAGVVDQVQVQLEIEGGCTGQMTPAASWRKWTLCFACCPPSPQPASLEVLKGGFFVPADQSCLVHLGEASGKQALAASKTKRRKTSSAHTEVATMETEMRNLTLKRNRFIDD